MSQPSHPLTLHDNCLLFTITTSTLACLFSFAFVPTSSGTLIGLVSLSSALAASAASFYKYPASRV